VARCLGIRHIWIDSLCIIQEGDNSADWNHEVTLMGDVYRKSYCNLAAGAAVDGDFSLFNTRKPMALCFPIRDRAAHDWRVRELHSLQRGHLV
jgi:hypothetical protein